MLNNKTLALNTAAQYPFVFLAATAKQGDEALYQRLLLANIVLYSEAG
tara:strand:+ start:375 stop:518 length:144 start_codon:yes stop_codon:yes gene_type:complete